MSIAPASPFVPTGITTGPLLAMPGDTSVQDVPSSAGDLLHPFEDTGRLLSQLGEPGYTTPAQYRANPGRIPPPVAPEILNKQYPGLDLTAPMPDAVAARMYERRQDDAKRADIAAREPSGLLNDAAQFGVGTLNMLLDPLDVAASFVPVVGEARYGAWLAGAKGLGGRAAIRAGVGAAQGAAGQVPIEALRAGMSANDHEDWSAANALLDIAYGAAGGGLLHVGGGLLHDVMGRHDVPQATQESALRTAVSQLAEDRPVEVAPIFHASETAAVLKQFGTHAATVSAEEEAALSASLKSGDIADARSAKATEQLARAAALEAEAASARGEIPVTEHDTTPERIAAIDQELAGAIPAARRADLTAERQMLIEGTPGGQGEVQLQALRDQAQAQGLEAAARRSEGAARLIRQAAQKNASAAAQITTGADRALKLQSLRIGSRQQVVADLAARSIRRFAGANGIKLTEDEIASYAARALAPKADIGAILSEIGGRADQARIGAGNRLSAALEAAGGKRNPESLALSARADRESAIAATPEGEVPAEAADEIAQLEASIKSAIDAGHLTENEPELQAAAKATADAATMGQLLRAGAACIMRNG